MSTEKRIRLLRELVLEAEGDARVACAPETGQILLLNESAVFLVERLEAGTTRGELVVALAERYGLDRDRAATDVDRALFDLAREGLVDHDRL